MKFSVSVYSALSQRGFLDKISGLPMFVKGKPKGTKVIPMSVTKQNVNSIVNGHINHTFSQKKPAGFFFLGGGLFPCLYDII